MIKMAEDKKMLDELAGIEPKKEEEHKPEEPKHFVLKVQDSSIENTSKLGGK
jgi:hypothetical protein